MQHWFQSLLMVPVVVRTALRMSLLPREDVRRLSEQLRRRRPLAHGLRDPQRLAAVTDRLGRLLPPWGMGRCLKRSLILLDLWSRCGLEPRLHLGMRLTAAGLWEGHAWLSAASIPSTETRYAEVYVF